MGHGGKRRGGREEDGRGKEERSGVRTLYYVDPNLVRVPLSSVAMPAKRKDKHIYSTNLKVQTKLYKHVSHLGGDARRPVAFRILKREERNKTSPYVSTHMTVLKREERHKTSPYVSQSTTPMTVLKREEHNKTSPCVFSSRNANNCTKKRRISLVTKCYSKFLKATHFDLASSYTKQIMKRSFSKSSF